jgi:flagellar biosynthesis/type III secretory pathway protein FliH
MAKVICSPTINAESRRKLPMGRIPELAQSQVIPGPSHDGVGVGSSQAPVAPGQEPVDCARLMSERDAALKRAALAEAQLAKIRQQLEGRHKEAWDIGYEKGFHQASEKAAGQFKETVELLKKLMASLSREQERLIRIAEDAAVEIGFAAAAKILGRVNIDDKLLAAMVKEAMSKVIEREGLIVHLCAEDFRRMEVLKVNSANNGNQWSNIEFKVDEQVVLGGCIIKSRAGSLEARLEYQLNTLKECLVEAHACACKVQEI